MFPLIWLFLLLYWGGFHVYSVCCHFSQFLISFLLLSKNVFKLILKQFYQPWCMQFFVDGYPLWCCLHISFWFWKAGILISIFLIRFDGLLLCYSFRQVFNSGSLHLAVAFSWHLLNWWPGFFILIMRVGMSLFLLSIFMLFGGFFRKLIRITFFLHIHPVGWFVFEKIRLNKSD